MDKKNIEWQLPIQDDSLSYKEYPIHGNAKIHCFMNGISLCKKYAMYPGSYDTTEYDERHIHGYPKYFCKKCVAKFKKMKDSEGRQ